MKAVLLLCLLAASQLSAEYVFFPGNPQLRNINLEIPGVLVEKKDSLTLVPEGDVDAVTVQKPLGDVESRAKFGFATAAAASSIKAATSSFASTSPIVTFQADSAISAAAPLCLACTCRLGRTTCREAGGIAFYPKDTAGIAVGLALACDDKGCALEAPLTMSACDPVCKKRTATCDSKLADATTLKCTENVNTVFCNTDCQFRASGEKVVCNQRAIANGVMNDLPKDVCSVFGGRKRRDAGAEHRQARFLGNSFLARLIPSPASTIRVPGAALLSYAPTGRCLPQEIANAPLCSKLD